MKKTVITVAFLLALCVSSASAYAAVGEGDAIFTGAVDRVVNESMTVRAARSASAADAASRSASNYLSGPEVGFDYKWPQQVGEGNRWGVEVSQEFEWPGVYGASRRAASSVRSVHDRRIESLVKLERFRVADALLELVEARKRLALLTQVADNVDSLCAVIPRMVERGQLTSLDERKAMVERLSVKERLASARADVTRLELTAARGVVGPEAFASVNDYPSMALLPLERYLDAPSLLTEEEIDLMADSETAAIDAGLERFKKLPAFSLGYAHEFEEGIHFNGLTVGMTLPSYGAGKSAKAADLEAETAALRLEESRLARHAQISADHAEALRLQALISDYTDALGASDYLQLLQKSFNGGVIPLTDYLSDQNWFIDAGLNFLSLQLRYNRLLLSLNAPL